MPAVYEPFAPGAGSQLSFTDGCAFEVDRSEEAQSGRSIGPEHQDGLHEAELGQTLASRHGVGVSERGDGVPGETDPQRPLAHHRAGPDHGCQSQQE
ncbi:MAG: hypothetical protein H0T50_16820 [Gemmatimonadales bacterium]|nr:hypothetical protein [Gemmatimonadales bacterium]